MEIVTLCGSSKFKSYFMKVLQDETMKGNIVLMPGVFAHADNIKLTRRKKAMLDKLHLLKIDRSHKIIVLNIKGYIGKSTEKEIRYARKQNKEVEFYV